MNLDCGSSEEDPLDEELEEGPVYIPALSERYESLDYDLIENQLFRKEEMLPRHQVNNNFLNYIKNFYIFILVLVDTMANEHKSLGRLLYDRSFYGSYRLRR